MSSTAPLLDLYRKPFHTFPPVASICHQCGSACSSHGAMTNWDFDELDELEAKFSADNPIPKAQDGGAPFNGANTTKEVPKAQPTVENCKRPLSGSWQQVLGVTQLDAAEVKILAALGEDWVKPGRSRPDP